MHETQIVLITGASRGIGAYLAEHFATQESRVVGCSRSRIEGFHSNVTHFQADVSDETQVHALMRFIRKKFGRLDVTINNAGVASMNPALLTPSSTIDRIMDTNFKGTVLVSRESARLMRRRRYGRIVNLTSIAVPLRLEGEAIYAASKSAVEMFTRILAHEVAPLGITCNAVGPAPIETDLIRNVPKEKIDKLVARLASKRLGRFEEVAHVIDFFVQPTSSCVTGQVLYLGGP